MSRQEKSIPFEVSLSKHNVNPNNIGQDVSLDSSRKVTLCAASVHACLSGSFTLEAAVLLPAFTCFLVAVLFFFRVIQVQQNLSEAMQYTGRKLSTTAFAERYGIGSEVITPVTYAGANTMVHVQYSSNFSDKSLAYAYIPAGAAGLSLLRSDTTGDFIDLKADYSLRLPIDFFGKKLVLASQEVKVRKWNGYQADTADATDDDEIWVYITPHGTVYHKDRNCHYLKLSIRSVSKSQVAGERNKEGACFYPCELCGARNAPGMVYVTDYGTSYHTSLTCSGLKRSIYMVRLSESEGRGPCSKCGY